MSYNERMERTLHNNIMRRVYYTYAIRLALHPVTVHGAFFACCIALLSQFVSFPNVWANMLNKKLGEVHLFFFESAQSTEVWTFVLVGMMLVTIVSFYIQMRRPRFAEPEMAYSG